MNKQSLSALTNAHAWVGLVISTVLFIVFLCGAFTLYRDNIIAWERDTIYPQAYPQELASLDTVVNNIATQYDIDQHHSFSIRLPKEHAPHYEVYFAEEDQDGNEIDHNLIVSSQSGEILGDGSRFTYGDFLYKLHVNLGFKGPGTYFVGVVTLFFFVAILSGVVIHWRKIINNFFKYRKDGKRDKWLDAHNLIGVMGLPFHIMYAFTGLVFNLVIVYQVAYAVILYQGDQNALLKDAGVIIEAEQELTQPMAMKGLDKLLIKANQELGSADISFVRLENFADQLATVTFRAKDPNYFSLRKEIKFALYDGEVLYKTLDNYDNDLRGGLDVVANLHFGNFAGYGLKLVFFLLGIGTCYIILSGNLLWLEKRVNNKRQSQLGLHLVRAMTSGVFLGAMLATALGFASARLLPDTIANRAALIENIWYATLAIALLLAFFTKKQTQFSVLLLKATSAVMLLIPVLDWLIVGDNIALLVDQGRLDVLLIHSILLCFAVCAWLIASNLTKKHALSGERDKNSETDEITGNKPSAQIA